MMTLTIDPLAPQLRDDFVAFSADGRPIYDGVSRQRHRLHPRVYMFMPEAIGLTNLNDPSFDGSVTHELPHFVGYDMTVRSAGHDVRWVKIAESFAPAVPIVKLLDPLSYDMRTNCITLVINNYRNIVAGWAGLTQPPLPNDRMGDNERRQSSRQYWSEHALAYTDEDSTFTIMCRVSTPSWAI